MADKAYSSRGIRSYLRAHGIQALIPEKEDQKTNRQRKGSAGGRPVSYDKEAYKRRNVAERSFNTMKQWRSLATRVRLARPNLPGSCRSASRRHLDCSFRRHAIAARRQLELFPISALDGGQVPKHGVCDHANDGDVKSRLRSMDVAEYFTHFNELAVRNPGTPADQAALQRFAPLFIGAGLAFRLDCLPPPTRRPAFQPCR